MPKKMRPDEASAYLYSGNKRKNAAAGVAKAKNFTLPVLKENPSGWYIEYYSFNPEFGRLQRCRIKMNRGGSQSQRRKRARDIMGRLAEQLTNGWSPFICSDPSNLQLFGDVLDKYETHIRKMLESGYFRKETYSGYSSNVKILREFLKCKRSIHYAYQFDRRFCSEFLDYVFIDRNNSAQTRNNYLNFLQVFSGYMVEKGYLSSRPTDGIKPISKRLYKKSRTVIPLKVVGEIAKWMRANDKFYLFACYLIYYCFIRPVEICRLKVADVNIKDCTIIISGDKSKNHKTQVVTVPKKVLLYAVEIGVFNGAQSDYLFGSQRLKPGSEPITPKIMRDHWAAVRRALNLKPEWKLYSLKDTGITEMADKNIASITIRDQARHSSLAITDLYTRHADGNTKGSPDLIDIDGAL